MLTQDARSWYIVITVAWLGSLWAHPDLVEKMMEGDRQSWIAGIGQLIAIVSAKLSGSPLRRRKYTDADRKQLESLGHVRVDGRTTQS